MGDNVLTARADGEIIPANDHNELVQALQIDVVPRDNNRVPTDIAGSLGTSLFRWLRGFISKLTIGEAGQNLTIESHVTNGIRIQNAVGDKIDIGPSTMRLDSAGGTIVSAAGSIDFYVGGVKKFGIPAGGIYWTGQPDASIPKAKVAQTLEYYRSSQWADDDFDGGSESGIGGNYTPPFTCKTGKRYMIALMGNEIHVNSSAGASNTYIKFQVDNTTVETYEMPYIVNFRMPCNLFYVYTHTIADAQILVEFRANHVGVDSVRTYVWEMP